MVGGTFPLPGFGIQTSITMALARVLKVDVYVAQGVNVVSFPLLPVFDYLYLRVAAVVFGLESEIWQGDALAQIALQCTDALIKVTFIWLLCTPAIALVSYCATRLILISFRR